MREKYLMQNQRHENIWTRILQIERKIRRNELEKSFKRDLPLLSSLKHYCLSFILIFCWFLLINHCKFKEARKIINYNWLTIFITYQCQVQFNLIKKKGRNFNLITAFDIFINFLRWRHFEWITIVTCLTKILIYSVGSVWLS